MATYHRFRFTCISCLYFAGCWEAKRRRAWKQQESNSLVKMISLLFLCPGTLVNRSNFALTLEKIPIILADLIRLESNQQMAEITFVVGRVSGTGTGVFRPRSWELR